MASTTRGRRLAYGLAFLAVLAVGWALFTALTGETEVLKVGETAHTSRGVVTVLRWELAPLPVRDGGAGEGQGEDEREEGEQGEDGGDLDESTTPSLLPGHVMSAVEFRSCASRPDGVQVDLRQFHLVMPNGSQPPLESTTATSDGGQCQRGLLFYQTPEGQRPAFVLFDASPSVEWHLESS